MIIDSGIVTGSLQVSGSFSVQGNTNLNGGLSVVGGITGSVSGSSATAVSASYADTAINAPYYVTTASYNADSASVSTRVTNLESWSSSLDINYATDAQLNASASALQAGVTASINVLSSSVAPQIASLQSWSSSLDTNYATDAQLNASASALQAGVTSSISVLSSSVAPQIAQNTATGSNLATRVTVIEDQYATTGSNTFTGTNNFNILSASLIYALSASIDYLSVIYQTSSIVYSSGSNQLGDNANDTQTLWGTVDMKTGPVLVTGSLNVSVSASANNFFGSGSSQFGQNVTDVQTFYGIVDIKNGPLQVTGSLNVAERITADELTVFYGITGSLFGTASYIEFAQTASLALLAELATSASHADNSNTAISSSYASQAQTANTASLASLALNATTASYIENAQSASYVQNAQTASYITLAQTASYVLQAQNAFSASYAGSATSADTASYVNLAQSASYVQDAQNAYSASTAILAQTASYILSAQSASHALFAISASNAQTASSAAGNFVVNGIMGVGGPANGLYQVYVTTSIDDGTLGLDSSGNYNAMYFLKGGLKKFEISTAGGDQTPVTQLIPYTSSGFFQIGNPSNASNDMIFLSEPTGGRVIIGPGIATGSMSLSGSQQTDLVQFTGNTFVSGALTVLGTQYAYGPIEAFSGLTGSLNGNAATATTATTAATASSVSTLNQPVAISGSLSVNTSAGNSFNINADTFIFTGSFDQTGSVFLRGLTQVSKSFVVGYDSTTGQLTYQTAVDNADTASYAISSSNAVSSSYAINASLAETASYVLQAVSSSYATTAPNYVLTASYNTDSSSLSTRTTNLESTASTLTTASASFVLVSASFSITSASYASASGSLSTRVTTIEGNYATTGSNTFTGTQYTSNDTNATSFTSTAALYTDGGLRVTKDSYVSGGLYVAGNLTVYGTSSVNYVTTSVFVGLEYINLNTDLPALRYAGINIGDSGSAAGISSSFWYDSEKDNWLYVHAHEGSAQTSSLAINGPIAYENLGNEQGLLGNYVTKAQVVSLDNNHHITSSQIYDDGTTVAIAGNLQVTGSLYAGNLTGSLNGSNLVAGSVGNDRLTNSAITIAGVSTSLGGSITAATILDGTGVFSGSAQIPSASITNTQLANNAVTVTAGTGLSGGGPVALGSSVTLTNAGVTSAVAGTAISVSGATGDVTITNTGVTSNVAGTGVTVSGATGAVTISIGQAVGTASNVQFNSLGVGTAGSAVAGEIRATADVTAFYSSDERLKENITPIENPIEKLMAIKGVTFDWKEGFEEFHSHVGADTGVIAQDIEAIELPGTVTTRETGYKAVKYEKLNALLIEVVKVQQTELNTLKLEFAELKAKLK